MSHEATNWAIKQTGKGLSPGAKLVLWHLADRHNPDLGCFPKQSRLAADSELSRSTVNRHLAVLEEKGLIRRERRIEPRTKCQLPTRYIFAFEDDFGLMTATGDVYKGEIQAAVDGQPEVISARSRKVNNKPCPKLGLSCEPESELVSKPCPNVAETRVSSVGHIEPVREPIREPHVGSASATHNTKDFDAFWRAYPRPRSREKSARLFARAVKSGIPAKKIVRAAERYSTENADNKRMYLSYSDNWLEAKRWEDDPEEPELRVVGGSTADLAAFWADKINSGCYVPVSAIKSGLAKRMLRSGLVTIEQIRRAGLNP